MFDFKKVKNTNLDGSKWLFRNAKLATSRNAKNVRRCGIEGVRQTQEKLSKSVVVTQQANSSRLTTMEMVKWFN